MEKSEREKKLELLVVYLFSLTQNLLNLAPDGEDKIIVEGLLKKTKKNIEKFIGKEI